MSHSPPSHWVDSTSLQMSPAPNRAWIRASRAVVAAMFSTSAGPPPAEQLDWTMAQLYDVHERVGGMGLAAYRLSLFAFTWLAPLMILRLPPFSRLSHAQQMRAMHRFESSLIAVALFALKAMLCMIYFEHPAAAAHMAFDGQGLRQHPAPAPAPSTAPALSEAP